MYVSKGIKDLAQYVEDQDQDSHWILPQHVHWTSAIAWLLRRRRMSVGGRVGADQSLQPIV